MYWKSVKPGYVTEVTDDKSKVETEPGWVVSEATEDDMLEYIEETYRGTCESMTTEHTDWLDKTNRHNDLDIFECAQCGWWYGNEEASDAEGETICEDCYND